MSFEELNTEDFEDIESSTLEVAISDTMESLLEEFSPKEIIQRGDIVDGTIVSFEPSGLVIDLGRKSEGFVPRGEMKSLSNLDNYESGDTLISYVVHPETTDGTILLSIDRAKGEQGWKILDSARKDGTTLLGKIIDSNKGGAVVECEGIQEKLHLVTVFKFDLICDIV